jgi:hypothetical protein
MNLNGIRMPRKVMEKKNIVYEGYPNSEMEIREERRWRIFDMLNIRV